MWLQFPSMKTGVGIFGAYRRFHNKWVSLNPGNTKIPSSWEKITEILQAATSMCTVITHIPTVSKFPSLTPRGWSLDEITGWHRQYCLFSNCNQSLLWCQCVAYLRSNSLYFNVPNLSSKEYSSTCCHCSTTHVLTFAIWWDEPLLFDSVGIHQWPEWINPSLLHKLISTNSLHSTCISFFCWYHCYHKGTNASMVNPDQKSGTGPIRITDSADECFQLLQATSVNTN